LKTRIDLVSKNTCALISRGDNEIDMSDFVHSCKLKETTNLL